MATPALTILSPTPSPASQGNLSSFALSCTPAGPLIHVLEPLVNAVQLSLLALPSAVSAQTPEFKLGFKALAEQVPQVVGTPLENERWGDNGDSLQRTTNGLMVWRKSDNWTAFTNGSRTWINGPAGVQERANEERFPWEAGLGVGDRIVKAGVAITVNSVGRVDKVATNVAKQGSVFVVVDITIENLSRPSLTCYPNDFQVQASDGYVYNGYRTRVDRELSNTPIPTNGMTRGRLALEVPEYSKGLVLLWDTHEFPSTGPVRATLE